MSRSPANSPQASQSPTVQEIARCALDFYERVSRPRQLERLERAVRLFDMPPTGLMDEGAAV